MNPLKKKKIISVLKYTWPFYIISALVIALGFRFIFGIVHRLPGYKKLTLFVSGEVTELKKLEDDMLTKYQDKEIKEFSCISSHPSESTYLTRLTVAGYGSADVLILPHSTLETVYASAFALDLSNELITSRYSSFTLYAEEEVNYGVKLDKEKVKEYMTLPDEDCYLFLNARSYNTGEYSIDQNVEHDMALCVLEDWGM